MALTPRRAALGAFALCALIAIAYLPPSPEARGPRFVRRSQTVERQAANRARERLENAVRRFVLSRRRDSALALLANRPAENPFLLFAPQVPPASREWWRGEVARRWSMLGNVSTRFPTGIMVIIDTAPEFAGLPLTRRGSAELDYYLPAALEGQGCLTVVRLHGPSAEQNGELIWGLRGETPTGLFGPCAFYALFGAGGRSLTEWLDGPGARFAVSFDSIVRRPSLLEGGAPPAEITQLLERLGFTIEESPLRPYRPRDLYQRACLMGRKERCGMMFTEADARFGFGEQTAVLEGVHTFRYGIGSRQAYLLSDLLAEKGRAAFADFWRSDEPLETAFLNAFGEPLDNFAYRWIRAHSPALPRGWRIPAPAFMWSVIVLIGLVVAGAAHATTRHVTDG